jgi:pyruvate dehydrogenase E2 component (dihydrolipoamide acetyltransferase)
MAMTADRTAEVRDLTISDGRRLRARIWPGTGKPLVLLHGLLDDSEGWAQVAADTDRPCIAIDLPGFGASSTPSRPRISAYAEAVCEGIEKLDVGGCTLVGHSLGGAVATAVAERCDDIWALALVAPAGFGHIRIAEAVTLPGIKQIAEATLPLALVNPLTVTAAYTTFVAHGHLPSRDLMGRVRRRAFSNSHGVSMAAEAIAAAGRSPRGFSRRAVAFTGPVAALWGESDALVSPTHVKALRRALPQAHVEIWHGMGHHPQRERPAQLAEFIEANAVKGRRRRLVVVPDAKAA